MVDSIISALEGIPKELIVFIISMLPILELRGGMIAASLLGISWPTAFAICIVGNMIPIPLILLFIRKIFVLLKKVPGISKVIEKIENIAGRKGGKINKSRNVGLFSFVAIPLPGTGAWMGALIATMLDIRMKKSLPIIFAGIVTAGIIMSVLSYLIPGLFF